MSSHPPYPKAQANKLIREIVKKSLISGKYSIGYTEHFKQELKNDRLDINDAHYILENGLIVDEPELDQKHGEWRYRVKGRAIDSKAATVLVITFPSRTSIKCITIFKTR
ncbi:MAG TPA: DUF4258 domain-containing protein [Thermodesulfobacteriota bacterium]|nr:DUF4258 domain-containing protein [Thermodesulfobacteriota bacterium]